MDDQDRIHRIKLLEARHKVLHSTVEALEAEKAPEKFIKNAKVEKLKIKDEVVYLKNLKIS